MKQIDLVVNGKVVASFYESDVEVAGVDDESVNLQEYLIHTVKSEMYYDGIFWACEYKFKERGE